jgi:hypothetical protein
MQSKAILLQIMFTLAPFSSAFEKQETFDHSNKLFFWFNYDQVYDDQYLQLDNKNLFDCTNKTDNGYYVHHDCRKYWHCLYVGTLFELALERKCPIGTMFHPIQGFCEVSNWVSSLIMMINYRNDAIALAKCYNSHEKKSTIKFRQDSEKLFLNVISLFPCVSHKMQYKKKKTGKIPRNSRKIHSLFTSLR